uniref:Uncharacterized protein n=1 Tax=Anguilla anguilla TaxID=7936 RepID=A0A0E9T0E8_ANGAN
MSQCGYILELLHQNISIINFVCSFLSKRFVQKQLFLFVIFVL